MRTRCLRAFILVATHLALGRTQGEFAGRNHPHLGTAGAVTEDLAGDFLLARAGITALPALRPAGRLDREHGSWR